jgi:uncharacterized protein (TIGR02246 family)
VNDIEAICRLKARYFRTLDTRDWRGFRDVFTSDVVVDTTDDGGERVSGVEEFMTYLHANLAGATTVHQGHMPEIDVLSESTATGIWAMSDIVIWTNGVRLDGYGHYHEFYVKAEGQWRIKSLTLTRLYTEFSDPGRGDVRQAVDSD